MLGFRVWDTVKNEFVKVPGFINREGDFIGVDGSGCQYYLHGFIPMQSTGQLDMDGKMIYEGDVISTDQGIFVYASCVRNFYISCLVHKLSGLKLIGNIYENEGLGVLKDAGI